MSTHPEGPTGNLTLLVGVDRKPERTDFTRELTELCRKHGVGIEGGQVWDMDRSWTGPDADVNAEYAIDEDGRLVRTF